LGEKNEAFFSENIVDSFAASILMYKGCLFVLMFDMGFSSLAF
jgi:hypothetical protein